MGKIKTPSSRCILILKRYTYCLIFDALTTSYRKILKVEIVAKTGLQKGIKKADTFQYPFLIFLIGRGDKIRTCDPLHPMQVLYQAELHPDNVLHIISRPTKIQFFFWEYTRIV